MARVDLLALTEDSLVQMANAGLVKRAMRDLAAGQGPAIAEGPDGTIEARFQDDVVTRLAPGRMPADATCTCPAGGMCRHRVALVLAYRQGAPADAVSAMPGAWDPGALDGEALEASLPAGERAALNRLLAAPFTVGLERGPVPTAHLPMATVRFAVPHAMAYARCDCVATSGCIHVALAIRAFRAQPVAATATLGSAPAYAEAVGDLAETVDAALSRLLADGIVAGMSAHGRNLDRAKAAAAAKGAVWLVLAVDEMIEQIEAYERRGARHDEERILFLAAELAARLQARDRGAALGLGEPMETAMAKTRLVSLGGRVTAQGREATASIVVADTDTGVAMLMERRFEPRDGEERLTAESIGRRHLVPGLSVESLARGQILTSVAQRRADGSLVLGAGSRGRTTLVPRARAQALPMPLRVTDLAVLLEEFAGRPPSFVRARSRTADIHVFDVDAVLGQAWTPGAQLWQAAAALPGDGGTLHLERRHDGAAPLALEVLVAAAAGRHGPIRQVSGPVRVEDGAVICEPWLLVADRVILPDFDTAEGGEPVAATGRERDDTPLGLARRYLAGALHVGYRRDRGSIARGRPIVAKLREAGYAVAARRLELWLQSGGEDIGTFCRAAIWLAAMTEG